MNTKQVLLGMVTGLLLLAAAPGWAAPPNVGEKAGNITALLPVAKVARGPAKQEVSTVAKKGDEVYWNDVVRTDKGGRARITLADQSILSLGSQAELRILKHDPKSLQTSLELGYGRVRAEVSPVTKQGGGFEVKTPTAVAGVIGTVFGIDSVIGATTFLCLSGTVMVGSNDPTIPQQVPCTAGMAAVVAANKPPVTRPATQQEIQQLIQDTEPAVISALAPATMLPGTTTDATVNGTKLGNLSGVTSSSPGVTASLNPGGTETSASIHLVVGANAQPGPVILTFTKKSGVNSAAVLSVLAPPNAPQAGGDLKKPYHDVIDQERQAALAALNGLGLGLSQSADAGYNQVSAANGQLRSPIDISPSINELKAPVQNEVNAALSQGTQVNQAAASAVSAFDARYQQAWNALQARSPNGPPDDQFISDLTSAFNDVNATLLAALAAAQNGLGTQVQQSNNDIQQITQNWLNRINQAQQTQQAGSPVPKVNSSDLTAELGATANFDAGSSTASTGATIATYSWVLCPLGFQPPSFGVVLSPSDAPQCNAVAGYSSSSPAFEPATCGLQPGVYAARLTITDSNNQSSVMFTRLTVNPPSYDDPVTRLQSLAQAYMSLQPDLFLSFFDPVGFSGFTSLSENVRSTFITLATMQINLRVSQSSTTCDQATLRADWLLKYTFKNDPTCANVPAGTACQPTVLSQQEQLTVRMNRTAGRGWFITDFQGDNGTVQGLPPVVVPSTTSLPDLVVTSVSGSAGSGQPLPVGTGAQTFDANITNSGNASFPGGSTVHFSLRSSAGELAAADASLPSVPPAASIVVSATLNIPTNTPPGTTATVTANANPTCPSVAESSCANNSNSLGVLIGTLDLALVSISVNPPRDLAASPWLSGEPLNFTVNIANNGTLASAGGEAVTLRLNGVVVGHTAAPSIPGGSNTNVVVHAIASDPVPTGAATLDVNIAADAAGDTNPANNTLALAGVRTSDWQLGVVGAGSTVANPLVVPIGSSAAAQVQATAASGSLAGPVTLVQGLTSSHITELLGTATLSSATSTSTQVTVSSDAAAANGQYFAQVIAQFRDGAAVTSQRQATIQVAVGTGVPADIIIVTSSAGNTSVANQLQLNGVLAQSINLTATRNSGQTTGSVDLLLSDAPEILSTPQQLTGIPYGTPEPVRFEAVQNPDGSITPVPTTVVVSATAVQTAAVRTSPSPSPVGTQQTTLFFNIGDINVTGAPACVQVAPGGGTASVTLSFQIVNGFNASTLTWQWLGLASGVTVNPPNGVDALSGSSYSPGTHTFGFTNNNTSSITGLQTFFFAVSISGPQGLATKTFAASFNLSSTSCSLLGFAANLRVEGGGGLPGTWTRGGPTATGSASQRMVTATRGLPDLQLSTSDVSFTPSLPKAGDTVAVRFRVTNAGDADATGVPISLVVNGLTVASDRFDLAAGKSTLAGLEWTAARLPSRPGAPSALIVVDPSHATRQKTMVAKSAPLAHFALAGSGSAGGSGGLASAGLQRTMLEVAEGACLGFRFASGAGSPCGGSADIEISADDLAAGRFTLTAQNGIADLGMAGLSPNPAGAHFNSQALAVAGHSYAVQLGSGKLGVFTLQAIRNPGQLDAKARQFFRKQNRAVRSVAGDSNGAVEPGDTSGGSGRNQPRVYFDVVYQGP